MKKALKLSCILFFAVLYGIVSGFVNTGAFNKGIMPEQVQDRGDYNLYIASNLICAAPTAESHIQHILAFPLTTHKIQAEDYKEKIRHFGNSISNLLNRYLQQDLNLFLHFRIPETIFPFHYFW